jgi:hypothetical protein
MHGHVVFDNNAYKAVDVTRLQRIMGAERKHGIAPLANVIVLQELLARVRNADPKVRKRNRAAIYKLGLHCRVTSGDRTDIMFLSHIESQVYRLLAMQPHPTDREMFNELGDMVRVVTEAGGEDVPLAELAEVLERIEQTVEKAEADYLVRLEVEVAAPGQPNKIKRNLNYAARVAARTQGLYGARFSDQQIVGRLIPIMQFTSVGFALQDAVVSEVRARGSHRQHANTVWDIEIVSSTSMDTSVAGRSVLLVTQESRLIKAAEVAGARDRVCGLAEYETLLGIASDG